MNYGCVIGKVNDTTLKVVPCSHDDFNNKSASEKRKMNFVKVRTSVDNMEVLESSGFDGDTYIYFNNYFEQTSPN